MDNEIFSDNFSEPDAGSFNEPQTRKINFSIVRIVICTIILIILSFFKHFSATNYKQFGDWYDNKFKIESFNAHMVKNFAFDKLNVLQEKIKCKINRL